MTSRVLVATRLGFREQARRPPLVVLLVVFPFFFVTRAIARTEAGAEADRTARRGEVVTTMRELCGAWMARSSSRAMRLGTGILQNPMFGDGTPGRLAYVMPTTAPAG